MFFLGLFQWNTCSDFPPQCPLLSHTSPAWQPLKSFNENQVSQMLSITIYLLVRKKKEKNRRRIPSCWHFKEKIFSGWQLKGKEKLLAVWKKILGGCFIFGFIFAAAKKNDAGLIRSLLRQRISWTRSSDWLALFFLFGT